MNKTEHRKAYTILRKGLSKGEVEELSMKIANRLLKLEIWDKHFYHIFLSIVEFNEVNTDYILNILAGKDKNIIISKCNFDRLEMTHYLLTDATKIKKNKYNIPEPVDGIKIETSKIEVVFVPLLAFDDKGNRIGYGKGFYDKFLSQCQSEIVKVGLSFFEAESTFNEIFNTDIGLDYCVTPDKIYQFK